MSSLVLELQREALSKNTSVADLLRKALVVARKLGVADLEKWVNTELNGYGQDMEVPDYRKLRGELKVWNPYRGYMPLFCADADMANDLSMRSTYQAIGGLEALLGNGQGNTLKMNFPPQMEQALMDGMEIPMQPVLMVSNAQIQAIIDSVRNSILEWSLKLEEAGILGNDMTFSQEEKARATEAQITYHVQNQTVIHGMQQSQVQLGTSDSTQVFVHAPLNLEAVAQLTAQLRAHLASFNLPAQALAEVKADLATVEAQQQSPKPRLPIIKEALRSMRAVLENAVGSVAGTALPGIVEQLKNLL